MFKESIFTLKKHMQIYATKRPPDSRNVKENMWGKCEHSILFNSNVNCHKGLDHVFNIPSSVSWLLWTEREKVDYFELKSIREQNLMQPPCSHRKLKCCSNTAWTEKSIRYCGKGQQTILRGYLTGESFVASVAAVCLLFARSREQPVSFNLESAKASKWLIYLSYCSLLITLTIWPSAVASVIASVSTTSSTTGSHTESSTKFDIFGSNKRRYLGCHPWQCRHARLFWSRLLPG